MIREASIYTLRKLSPGQQEEYGLRVLTMRRWPRGIRCEQVDLWIPSAAPTASLLYAWHTHHVHDWEAFLDLYRRDQVQQRSCRVVSYLGGRTELDIPCRPIDYLRQLEQRYGTLTVCCWEPEQCHRHALKELVEQVDV